MISVGHCCFVWSHYCSDILSLHAPHCRDPGKGSLKSQEMVSTSLSSLTTLLMGLHSSLCNLRPSRIPGSWQICVSGILLMQTSVALFELFIYFSPFLFTLTLFSSPFSPPIPLQPWERNYSTSSTSSAFSQTQLTSVPRPGTNCSFKHPLAPPLKLSSTE